MEIDTRYNILTYNIKAQKFIVIRSIQKDDMLNEKIIRKMENVTTYK